ncbi:MAG: DNA alkylation repair protein [Marinilabilia sp.]
MVRKGYGWMLKVASRQHPEEVFEFVIQRIKHHVTNSPALCH